MNKQALIQHLISGAQTFLSAFGLAVYPFVINTDFTSGVTKAALVAIAITGIRAGIKAIYQAIYPASQLTVTTVSVNSPAGSVVVTPVTTTTTSVSPSTPVAPVQIPVI